MTKTSKKGLFIGKSHKEGGIPSEVVETGQQIEIEGNEYYFCAEAYNSNERFDLKNKTNREVLDYIYTQFSCKFDQSQMNAGDFIVCKVVVLDKKKYNRKGTLKKILNQMQAEKSCKVESNPNSIMKKGGQTSAQSNKISKVMGEFKRGKLKTSHGKKVTDEKQAIAIALSEAGVSYAKGGGFKGISDYDAAWLKKNGLDESLAEYMPIAEKSYQKSIDFKEKEEEVKTISYEQYKEGQDIKHNGRGAFVIENNKESKVLTINYFDDDSVDEIKYEGGGFINNGYFTGHLSFLNW